jgi:hypothetical protein
VNRPSPVACGPGNHGFYLFQFIIPWQPPLFFHEILKIENHSFCIPYSNFIYNLINEPISTDEKYAKNNDPYYLIEPEGDSFISEPMEEFNLPSIKISVAVT